MADYVLRSVSAVFPALIAAVALLLAGEFLDRVWIRPRLQATSNQARDGYRLVVVQIRRICFALELFIIGATLLELPIYWPYNVLFPIGLATALIARLYVDRLVAKYPQISPPGSNSKSSVRRVILMASLLVSVFWALGLHAEAVGESVARDLASGTSSQPSLEIFTTQRLSISGPDVTVDPITQPDTKFRYVYRALRLLIKTPSKFILLPGGWQKGIDAATLLPDDGSIRVDVIAPRQALR